LEEAGFKQSKAEPCLFYKAVDNYFVLLVVHVDDCYVVEKPVSIQQVIQDIEASGLKLKSEYNTKDYLSCEIKFDKNRKTAWIGQPHQVKKLVDLFGELVKGCQKYKKSWNPQF
jgi:hypothetical protein